MRPSLLLLAVTLLAQGTMQAQGPGGPPAPPTTTPRATGGGTTDTEAAPPGTPGTQPTRRSSTAAGAETSSGGNRNRPAATTTPATAPANPAPRAAAVPSESGRRAPAAREAAPAIPVPPGSSRSGRGNPAEMTPPRVERSPSRGPATSPPVIGERRSSGAPPVSGPPRSSDRERSTPRGGLDGPPVISDRRSQSSRDVVIGAREKRSSSAFGEQNRGLPGLIVNRRLDNTIARRQLSIAPRRVALPPPPPPSYRDRDDDYVVGANVKRYWPRRVYNRERNVVMVVEDNNEAREMPFIAVPVLFVRGTNRLLDEESAQAISDVARAIREVSRAEPDAMFDVEGHTSTDGSVPLNANLSAQRAQRVLDDLIGLYGVNPRMLTAHGYGESYPAYPDGTEEEMMLDRRVLVVRTR